MARENQFTAVRGSDQTLVGAGTLAYSPKMVEVFGNVGLDFAFLDLEHSGFSAWDSEQLESYTRAADQADIDLLVRLPSGEADHYPPLIRKVLDTGVRNVLIPRIETAEQVERAVEAANFNYAGGLGDRGLGAGRSSSWGGIGEEYVENEDASTQVGVMIENTTAVENLDEILSVPDLGFVFIGPADLSHSLGHPAKFSEPVVQETVAEIEDAVVSAELPLGSFAYDATDPGPALEKGYQLLVSGFDLGAVRDTFEDVVERTNEAASARRE